jgi:thioredoxin reductase
MIRAADALIVGAGPAGLAAAYERKRIRSTAPPATAPA